MRKEPAADCVTPSNKLGLKGGHGIPHGEGLDIWQTLEKLKYNCWCFRIAIIISERMSLHATGLMAQLSQILERSPSPYWDLMVVCRDGAVRWETTENWEPTYSVREFYLDKTKPCWSWSSHFSETTPQSWTPAWTTWPSSYQTSRSTISRLPSVNLFSPTDLNWQLFKAEKVQEKFHHRNLQVE